MARGTRRSTAIGHKAVTVSSSLSSARDSNEHPDPRRYLKASDLLGLHLVSQEVLSTLWTRRDECLLENLGARLGCKVLFQITAVSEMFLESLRRLELLSSKEEYEAFNRQARRRMGFMETTIVCARKPPRLGGVLNLYRIVEASTPSTFTCFLRYLTFLIILVRKIR